MELRNDHNVYILGAGFSRGRGYPVMVDFLNRMRDAHPWLEQNDRNREAKAVQNILEFRLKSASAGYRITSDLENIEELFSLAAATPGAPRLMNDVRLAIAATLDYCQQTTESQTATIEALDGKIRCRNKKMNDRSSQTAGFGTYEVDYYDALVARMCGALSSDQTIGDNTIITFNYDTLVEEALTSCNLPWTYGFEGTRHVWHESFQPVGRRGDSRAIPVNKLHGSINWAYATGKGKGFSIYGSYTNVIDNNATPDLIPPTWRKSFDKKMSTVWDNSVKALQTATRIIIIGFSIPETDMHFKHLIAAGLQNNISLRKIIFVSPDSQIKERASKIFRDLKLCTFENTLTEALFNKTSILNEAGRPFPTSSVDGW